MMNRPVSIDRALSDARLVTQSPGKRSRLGLAGWALVVGVAAIVCAALATESSLTVDQRVKLLEQSSVYP
jgi:hypothetical protein